MSKSSTSSPEEFQKDLKNYFTKVNEVSHEIDNYRVLNQTKAKNNFKFKHLQWKIGHQATPQKVMEVADPLFNELLDIASKYLDLIKQDPKYTIMFNNAISVTCQIALSKKSNLNVMSFLESQFKDVSDQVYYIVCTGKLALMNASKQINDVFQPSAKDSIEIFRNTLVAHIDKDRAPIRFSVNYISSFFHDFYHVDSDVGRWKTANYQTVIDQFDTLLKVLSDYPNKTYDISYNNIFIKPEFSDFGLFKHFMANYLVVIDQRQKKLREAKLLDQKEFKLERVLSHIFQKDMSVKSLRSVKEYYELNNKIIDRLIKLIDVLHKYINIPREKLSNEARAMLDKFEKIRESHIISPYASIVDPKIELASKHALEINEFQNPNMAYLSLELFRSRFLAEQTANKEMIRLLGEELKELNQKQFEKVSTESKAAEEAKWFPKPAPVVLQQKPSTPSKTKSKKSHSARSTPAPKPQKEPKPTSAPTSTRNSPTSLDLFKGIEEDFNDIAYILNPAKRRAELTKMIQDPNLNNPQTLYKTLKAQNSITITYWQELSKQFQNLPFDMYQKATRLLELNCYFVKLYHSLETATKLLKEKGSCLKGYNTQRQELESFVICFTASLDSTYKDYQRQVESTRKQLDITYETLSLEPWWKENKKVERTGNVSDKTKLYKNFKSFDNHSREFKTNIYSLKLEARTSFQIDVSTPHTTQVTSPNFTPIVPAPTNYVTSANSMYAGNLQIPAYNGVLSKT